MATTKVNIREAQKQFREILNKVTYEGDRVILMSRNKPMAAIVRVEEAKSLENEPMRKARRLLQLEQIRRIRERLAHKKVKSSSVTTLKKLRGGRFEGPAGRG